METSYNGWPASERPADLGIVPLVVAGESFAPGVRRGDVHTVLGYVAAQMHARVEPIVRSDWHAADDWGWNYRTNRNANNLSCHASGTAIDYNATRHPNGKSGTFTLAQVREIRRILSEVGGVVRWGGDFSGTKDEMHFEISKPATDVAKVATRLRTPAPTPTPGDDFMAALTDQQQRDMHARIMGGIPGEAARVDARVLDDADGGFLVSLLTDIQRRLTAIETKVAP